MPNADDRKLRYQRKLEIVVLMHRTGVRLLAGTDAPNPYVFPGFSLHEELELLVQAGLTPLEALQTATVNPAKFLGKEQELGTIEKANWLTGFARSQPARKHQQHATYQRGSCQWQVFAAGGTAKVAYRSRSPH
jgi:cytosine/adenosine deaminase-related metal-dependent hydrolase